MLIDLLLSKFEIIIFFSIILIVIGFFLLFFYQNQNFKFSKDAVVDYANIIKNSNKETRDYLLSIANILEQHKNEITKISDRLAFIEREIGRLGNIKGSEDMLSIAIEMTRKGENREDIKNKTGLRDDEIEAIYTYYRK
jgi:hypothetical protein